MAPKSHRIDSDLALGRAKVGEGLLLGSSAMAAIALGAVATWITPPLMAAGFDRVTGLWAGAILAFFAGVRRGLTFSEAGGASVREIATMLSLFSLAVLALWLGASAWATGVLIAGYLGVAVLDALAAKQREAPGYFILFRPAQMAVGVAGLAALLVWRLHR